MVELEAFVSLPTANNIKDGPTCGAVSFSAPLTKAGSHVCPVPIADLASVTRALRLPAAGVASGHSPRKKPCPLYPPKSGHWVRRFRSEPMADIDSITSSARVGPLFAQPQKDQKLWIL